MTDKNNAPQPLLTDEEINAACDWPASNTTMRAENDRAMAREVEAAVLRKLSKLRAPVADERAAFSRAEISFPLTIPENRVYLAGPMTGYKDHNFPAFHDAAEWLRGFGMEVVNPADHGLVDGLGWADYMRWDLVKLAGCHSVTVLPGWEKSKGASLEVSIAQALGMPAFTIEGAPLASAPVAEPETMEEIHRRERERAPWVLPKDPTLPVSVPVADEPTKPRPPMLRIPGVREDVLRRAAERITSAPVAGEAHTALNEWFDKTDFIQKRIASGELPVKYLGWHRADVMRDLIEQPRPSDDKLWDQTLAERDEYHDMADKLANAIADHLLVEIGEHSSSNCPWMRALEAIENAAPQASDAVRNQALEEAAQTAYKALFPTNDRSDWTEFAESASFNAKYAAQCIRALKSQSAALSAQPGAQKEQSDV